ncbi:fumarylacetoacetate hydrolase [Paenibacillus swuensis]|uniref:Fumarylacetoacetate hydrolase n=1 Tax=Paenibacillus swuensis TaxID=1178515 RepID=A0A172TMV2_9BACL|nr:fumarylacetoacetate hydrolase family protein [Paenibacillus swuensis]ANE48312.1 fumarylacetoacetate hydrolase [Paenibacillus swuensis]
MHHNHIRNIYCVGRNYGEHAAELGNAIPDKPMIFTKPTHALITMNGDEIALPGSTGEVHYEAELVLHIGKPYVEGEKLSEMIDSMALGLDFTLRDVQSELKKKGHPWLAAKGFRNSAALTSFLPFPGEESLSSIEFSLTINGKEVQRGNSKDMIFSIEDVLEFIHFHYGLGPGDLIYTGTPAGVGPIASGDHTALFWGKDKLGEATIILC